MRPCHQPSPTALLPGVLSGLPVLKCALFGRLRAFRPSCVGQHGRSHTHRPLTKAGCQTWQTSNFGQCNLPRDLAVSIKQGSRTHTDSRSPQVDLNDANPGADRPHFMPIRLVQMTELSSKTPSFVGIVCSLPQTQIDRLVSGKLSRGTLHCETDHPSVHSRAAHHVCSGPTAHPWPGEQPGRLKKTE